MNEALCNLSPKSPFEGGGVHPLNHSPSQTVFKKRRPDLNFIFQLADLTRKIFFPSAQRLSPPLHPTPVTGVKNTTLQNILVFQSTSLQIILVYYFVPCKLGVIDLFLACACNLSAQRFVSLSIKPRSCERPVCKYRTTNTTQT